MDDFRELRVVINNENVGVLVKYEEIRACSLPWIVWKCGGDEGFLVRDGISRTLRALLDEL